ncbi:hypothetical protein TWF730_000936 [Orbilia blumenaviensis]|uniref:RRM domain-containing protein n=1 Tax=Orbilia blumenaviensis TaxID=1796055 RepID=A0AAV9VN37_9PEZI
MIQNDTAVCPSVMETSNPSQQGRTFYSTPYVAVTQPNPAAHGYGLHHSAPRPHQLGIHPNNFHQSDNINFPSIHAQSHYPYNSFNSMPFPLPMPSFPLHPVPSGDTQYYHSQHFPPTYPPVFPFYPAHYQTFIPYVKPSQHPPYDNIPSPVLSMAHSTSSTGFSNSKGLSSPATTVSSTATNNRTRKSPVIASTPQVQEDEGYDFNMSSSSSSIDEDNPKNVYIKGLPENMTDKQLREMVTQFGEVISSKAIIDRPSGACKGYGFAKFEKTECAKACMEYLKSKSYQTSFAKDSFYSQLKGLADLKSTNLYVSNLPVNWGEARILAIFKGYKISKCRLLLSPKNIPRGVAFVTFEDRDVCDEVIEKFTGIELGQEGHPLKLQVRYADTLAQKQLKKEKQAVGLFPKPKVIKSHHLSLEKGMRLNACKGELRAPVPMHMNWRNNSSLPPTPPRSIVGAGEDTLSSNRAE